MRLAGFLACVLLVVPLTAAAQAPAKPARIGVLGNSAAPPDSPLGKAFRARLIELGYVDGRTMQLDARYAEGRPERFPSLAADLVRLDVQVILTIGSQATRAARDAAPTIPIVFAGVAFPVDAGFVASLARPGGNITGVTDQAGDLWVKQLDLLVEAAPRRSRVGVLWDAANPAGGGASFPEEIARRFRVHVVSADVRRPEDLDAAFAKLEREGAQLLLVSSTPTLVQEAARVAAFAFKHRLPAISSSPRLTDAGLLLSYGPSWPELLRRAADYVDRVLKGARPAEMPVEQPTRFELAVNTRTAKAIGVVVPPSVLVRTDRLID